jgi:hypothetical protein
MLAAIPGYMAGMFGYVITATRTFDAQLPLFCAVARNMRSRGLAADSALRIARRSGGSRDRGLCTNRR